MDRIHQAVQGNTSGKPVVVIMGEEHPKPAHRLLQQAILHLSQESGLKPVYHFEHEHNLLERVLRTKANFELSNQQLSELKLKDVSGHLLLRAIKTHEPMQYSPRAADNIFGFCIDNGISVSFTDAAKKTIYIDSDERFLNLRDRATQNFAAGFLERSLSEDEEISVASSPEGMAIRNNMMCQNSLKSAADTKLDIIIHHCGTHHAVGDARYGFSYEDSLAKRFRDKGCPVLVVYPDTNNMSENIPAEAGQQLVNTLLIKDLPNQSFAKNDPMEKWEVDRIISASGDLITRHDENVTKPVYAKRLREHVQQLLGVELV